MDPRDGQLPLQLQDAHVRIHHDLLGAKSQ